MKLEGTEIKEAHTVLPRLLPFPKIAMPGPVNLLFSTLIA